MSKKYFLLSIFFYIITILYLVNTVPITPHEAKIFYTSTDIVAIFMRVGNSIINSIFGLRVFFVLCGFLSILFFYKLNKYYFSSMEDVYLSTFIFMLLPGFVVGTILANIAIISLPLVLLFILLYEKNNFIFLPLIMLILFFIHEASILFFIAIFIYAIVHNDKKLSILSSVFLLAFIYLAKGINIGGRPVGHFVEIFGLYATLFSPFLFFYFFYVIYRILLREKKELIWYISFISLLFSFIVSIRQKINITDFAPYVMITIPLMLNQYNKSLRVRLPEFQKKYKLAFKVVISFLFFTIFSILFYHILFFITDNKRYFANKIYKPYFLSKKLHKEGVMCKNVSYKREQYQLQFYKIYPCTK